MKANTDYIWSSFCWNSVWKWLTPCDSKFSWTDQTKRSMFYVHPNLPPSAIQLLNFYVLHEVQWCPKGIRNKERYKTLTWLFGTLPIKGSAEIHISTYLSVVLWHFTQCCGMHHGNLKDRWALLLFWGVKWEKRWCGWWTGR